VKPIRPIVRDLSSGACVIAPAARGFAHVPEQIAEPLRQLKLCCSFPIKPSDSTCRNTQILPRQSALGFVLTIVYIVLALLSPETLLSSLAEYRIQAWIALMAAFISFPALLVHKSLRVPQMFLLAGLTICVGFSSVVNHWMGGAILALGSFLPSVIVFYLALVNCRSVQRIRIVALAMGLVAMFYTIAGAIMYASREVRSPLILSEKVRDGVLFRIRGYGFLSDPNDLAQFFIVVIPLLWIRWRRGRLLQNVGLVILPTLVLLYGLYLTHSRGAIIALGVVLLFSLKDRLGAMASVALAGITGLLVLALNFTGGRAISAGEGAERMEAWGAGLQFLKANPLFGIGYGRFVDEFFITAHNSFVLCAAELGMVGYFFWMAAIVFTFSELNMLTSSHVTPMADLDGAAPVSGEPSLALLRNSADLLSWAKAVRLSLIGFLTAAWFLSRAFSMLLFLLAVIVAVLAQLRADTGLMAQRPQSKARLLLLTVLAQLVSIVVIWIGLRFRSF
jgi:hypothetical protein